MQAQSDADTNSPVSPSKTGLPLLALGAIGVVFGDIGTSPLYAMKEAFVGHHPLAVNELHVFGILSLIFWALMLIVTLKYVLLALRADNQGEGGAFALLALLSRETSGPWLTPVLVTLGVLAASLFYGDAVITPAISVLSAAEGLTVINPELAPFVLPTASAMLIALFAVQFRGTGGLGKAFGPVVLVYFLTLAGLGVLNIGENPAILGALNPAWAVRFFVSEPSLAFLALGSIFLAVTGAEALYADLGHFGRRAIGISWLMLVYPCLMLNYLGQGALVIETPAAIANPFFLMAPEALRIPLLILTMAATIIASQAVITGAFSLTHQAIQLGYLPRLRVRHTNAAEMGQIYIPLINWALLVMVLVLVWGFQSSSSLAAAYGIAVTGTMVITTCMLGVLVIRVWRWPPLLGGAVIAGLFAVEGVFFFSNAMKVLEGGWVPIVLAILIFVLLTTWARGRAIMREALQRNPLPLNIFIKSARSSARCAQGTAIFLTASDEGVPSALYHNLKHNQVLHERVILLNVRVEPVPIVPEQERLIFRPCEAGFFRMTLRYGFAEEMDVPRDLLLFEDPSGPIKPELTSYFLGRQKPIATREIKSMALWREHLFAWLLRTSESAMDYFRLPTDRVIEIGSQLRI